MNEALLSVFCSHVTTHPTYQWLLVERSKARNFPDVAVSTRTTFLLFNTVLVVVVVTSSSLYYEFFRKGAKNKTSTNATCSIPPPPPKRNIKTQLTPGEAFVYGCVFVQHQSVAAMLSGKISLTASPWVHQSVETNEKCKKTLNTHLAGMIMSTAAKRDTAAIQALVRPGSLQECRLIPFSRNSLYACSLA